MIDFILLNAFPVLSEQQNLIGGSFYFDHSGNFVGKYGNGNDIINANSILHSGIPFSIASPETMANVLSTMGKTMGISGNFQLTYESEVYARYVSGQIFKMNTRHLFIRLMIRHSNMCLDNLETIYYEIKKDSIKNKNIIMIQVMSMAMDQVFIKSMHMRKYGYILVLFFLMSSWTVFVGAQQSSKDKKFMRIAKTNDLLYISDTIVYMMSKSPIEVFTSYKDIYASYNLNKRSSVWIPYGFEVGRHFNPTYQIIWSLKDSTLYLSDLYFYNLDLCNYKSVFPNNEQFKLMEGLTGIKFNKEYPPMPGNPFVTRNTIGLMPATWSNDTILIKLARSQSTEGKGPLLPIYCKDLNDTIYVRRNAPAIDIDHRFSCFIVTLMIFQS